MIIHQQDWKTQSAFSRSSRATAAGVIAVMILGGPWVLNRWIHGIVPPSRMLLSILLLVVAFYALWSTISTIMYATNQHQRLSAIYLGGTAATVALTYVAAQR